MAEAGGALLGYAIGLVFDEVLKNFRHLKNTSANVLKLHNLLERLQPLVKQLCSSAQHGKHAADKWLIELCDELEKCRDFVKASSKVNRNILKSLRTSKESLRLYGSIYALLQEASVQQWASELPIQSVLLENDAKILAKLSAVQERDEQLCRRIADLPSKIDILRTISKLEQNCSSSSSAVPTETICADTACKVSEAGDGPSMSAIPIEILVTDSACDIPEPRVTFGGEAVANGLIDHLLRSDCEKWIALYGMGGIGKTFTAGKVYHDSRIRRHFAGGVIWLTVSKDQLGPYHLFNQLLFNIEGRESMSQLPKNLWAAKSYLKSKLDREKVLLVLDDVWQNDVLEYLDVISESKGGVILVTTRDQGILRTVIDSVRIFEIPRLSEEDSWQCFSYHAFRARGRVSVPEVDAVAKRVAEECGGLPLALEVIGSTMAYKELVPAERALGRDTLRVWEIALERLMNANHENNEYDALYLKLQLSVDSLLEQDSRLQDCFFYFAAFAEDELVSVKQLVRMWVAEGLVQDDMNSSFSAEEEGKVLLGFLSAKSMIEVTQTSLGKRRCKIHDVLRDVALRNLNHDFTTGKEVQASARKCLYAPGSYQFELPKEWTTSATPSSAKRISLRVNNLRQFPKPQQFDAPHLQLLILSMNSSLQSLSSSFFQNLSNLKVLDLSHTGIEKVPGTLVRRLKSLVLLNLTSCENLEKVSDEINTLQNLEFLLLKNCHSLQKLPRVSNLTKLKVYCAAVPPQEAAEMNSRDDLRRWEIFRMWRTHSGKSRWGILYMLPPNLRQLKLYFPPATEKYLFDMSSLRFLEKLRFYNSKQSFPVGMMELHHLKVVKIIACYGSPVPPLGRLPLLEDLRIDFYHDAGTESYGYEGAFPSLKNCQISCNEGMEKMFVLHPGAMPKIETLTIMMDEKEQFPHSIPELRSLKSLTLSSYGHRVRDEDLEIIFEQSDCFPHLQYLEIKHVNCSQLRGSLQSILPKHILERQEQGKLRIEYHR